MKLNKKIRIFTLVLTLLIMGSMTTVTAINIPAFESTNPIFQDTESIKPGIPNIGIGGTGMEFKAFLAPTDLKAKAIGDIAVELTWKDNADSETSYNIFRDSGSGYENIGSIPENKSDTATYTDDDSIKGGKTYKYRVKAVKGLESTEDSNEVSITMPKLGAPDGLDVAKLSGTSVVLKWNDNSNMEDGYKLCYGNARDALNKKLKCISLPADTTDEEISGLQKGGIYIITVCAVRGSTESETVAIKVTMPVAGLITGKVEKIPGKNDEEEKSGSRTDEELPGDEEEEPGDEKNPGDEETGGGSPGESGTGDGADESETDIWSEVENVGGSDEEDLTELFDGTESDWAIEEIVAAYQYGLTYSDIMSNYKNNITREEFCKIVVKLYEGLSGKEAIAEVSPFTDTKDPEIIKAYRLGIVLGVGNDLFAPEKSITRQEICVMIKRALEAAMETVYNDFETEFPFTDVGKIGTWATDAMRFCYKYDIMKGISETEIAPLNNTTREQALALLKRTYKKFR